LAAGRAFTQRFHDGFPGDRLNFHDSILLHWGMIRQRRFPLPSGHGGTIGFDQR
jgi:hypothetical protein